MTDTFAAQSYLKGKTIMQVRYLTEHEANVLGWPFIRPLQLVFTDGTCVYMSDGGRIVTSDGHTIPMYFTKDPIPAIEEDGILTEGENPIHPFDETPY